MKASHTFILHALLLFVALSTSLTITDAATKTAAPKPLIAPFRRCAALNSYYINALLPLVTDEGIVSTSSIYIQSQAVPRGKFNRSIPGGPAGLPLRRRRRRPLRIAFSNLTDPLSAAAEERDEAAASGASFTGTNVQVKGVDEPDIIKIDGRRVFTLSGNVLSVVRILANGRRGRRVARLRLPEYPSDMLIEGDYLLLIASKWGYTRPVYTRFTRRALVRDLQATIVYQIRVNPITDKPTLVQTLSLEGRYVRARETDGVARFVLKYDPLSALRLFRRSYPSRASAKERKRWNRDIVRLSRPAMWLPTYLLRRGKRVRMGVYARCGDVYRATRGFAGFNILAVVTLDVNATVLAPSAAASGIISDADKVYSTKKAMYVTTSEFRIFDRASNRDARWGANYETAIHKFALRRDSASYEASGKITGSVINQFAMHEWRGVFFIATTDGSPWWTGRDLTRSKVTSFRSDRAARQLVRIGEVGDLGVDERIYAVRYRWDTAYVVTFRETDPLYIIDLGNPRRLRVTGELKIPGFSSYLHNVGPGLLLGVGKEATNRGRITGAKVSLFDVSDKSKPKELSTWVLENAQTEVDWDHRAFLWYRKERIAVMPVNVYYGSKSFTGSIILNVSNRKITERGRVVHTSKSGARFIKRNAIIGGKYLWSMSDEFLQVNNIKRLKKVESKVRISG